MTRQIRMQKTHSHPLTEVMPTSPAIVQEMPGGGYEVLVNVDGKIVHAGERPERAERERDAGYAWEFKRMLHNYHQTARQLAAYRERETKV